MKTWPLRNCFYNIKKVWRQNCETKKYTKNKIIKLLITIISPCLLLRFGTRKVCMLGAFISGKSTNYKLSLTVHCTVQYSIVLYSTSFWLPFGSAPTAGLKGRQYITGLRIRVGSICFFKIKVQQKIMNLDSDPLILFLGEKINWSVKNSALD